MNVIADSLTAHTESSGKHALSLYATFDGFFHYRPDLGQIIPYSGTFNLVDIFPVACSAFFAELLYVLYFCQRIDRLCRRTVLPLFHNITSAY